jgi:CheY-like chemotaxis protein
MTSFPDTTVLLITDLPSAGSVLREVLRGLGCRRIQMTSDLDQAIAFARVRAIGLLVVDHCADAAFALEAVRRFRDADASPCPGVPVVFVSAEAERSRIEAARDAGVDQFCRKPVQAGVLDGQLRRLLRPLARAG